MDAPYQKHSETSKAAAESIKRAMPTQRHLIYCIFVANPDTAFTDNDLIEYVTEHDIGLQASDLAGHFSAQGEGAIQFAVDLIEKHDLTA